MDRQVAARHHRASSPLRNAVFIQGEEEPLEDFRQQGGHCHTLLRFTAWRHLLGSLIENELREFRVDSSRPARRLLRSN